MSKHNAFMLLALIYDKKLKKIAMKKSSFLSFREESIEREKRKSEIKNFRKMNKKEKRRKEAQEWASGKSEQEKLDELAAFMGENRVDEIISGEKHREMNARIKQLSVSDKINSLVFEYLDEFNHLGLSFKESCILMHCIKEEGNFAIPRRKELERRKDDEEYYEDGYPKKDDDWVHRDLLKFWASESVAEEISQIIDEALYEKELENQDEIKEFSKKLQKLEFRD